MSFFVELWESVFTPGTSPALMKATHGSFIMLLLSLLFLIFYSGSIHFINLFVIASCLYAAVIWFVNELKNIKLKDNEELAKEGGNSEKRGESGETEKSDKAEKSGENADVPSARIVSDKTGVTTGVKKPIGAPTKRKT